MTAKVINPGLGQYGFTTLDQKLPQNAQEFGVGTTVAAKNVVYIDTTGKVAPIATNANTALSMGVALEAGVPGDQIRVAVGGVALVDVNGTVTAGSIVKPSVTTAARVAVTATPAAGEAIGVAIDGTTITTGTCYIWVAKSL